MDEHHTENKRRHLRVWYRNAMNFSHELYKKLNLIDFSVDKRRKIKFYFAWRTAYLQLQQVQQSMQQPLLQEEQVALVAEEVLAEAEEPIHQVQEEEEDGKNNKKYPKRYGRPSMDPSRYVYCLGCSGRKCKDYCWLWNHGNNCSLDNYKSDQK